MSKIYIEVYDVDTEVYCVYKNVLHRGKILKYVVYKPGVIKYDLMLYGTITKDSHMAADIEPCNIYESKEAYIEYITKLNV